MKKRFLLAVVAGSLFATQLFAASLTVDMYKTGEKKLGPAIGKIYFDDTERGLLIKPQLSDLPPGKHGFHIHQKPSCANAGNAAGGHFDPADTDKHLGPKNKQGHLGDLPVLVVAKDGKTHEPMLAPRLKVSDIINHAVMIHAGSDNYSDQPKPLGGGGARIACGVAQ